MEYPLTPAQMGFYPKGFPLEQILWNHGAAVFFPGAYSPDQIQAALRSAVAAFEELRLCFAEREGIPFCYVSEEVPRQFPHRQFSSRQEVMDALQELIDEPFEMAGPLYRCAVFDCPEGSGVMIGAHHMVIDGYSVQVAIRFIHDHLEGLTPSGQILSYADHFDQERDYRNTKRFQRDRQYWAEQLSIPVAQLFPGGMDSIRYAARELVLEPDSQWMEPIRRFCQAQGVTPAAFFSTVLATWLRHECGQSPVRLGLATMNRTTAAELCSAGLFMRILPLTVDLREGSFADCARRTERQKMDLFRHQRLTRTELDELLREQDSGGKAPFEVVFDYQQFPQTDLVFSYSSALSVPLELHFIDHGARQSIHIRYRTALFSEDRIRDLSQRFLGIAAAAAASPQLPPEQLPQYTLSPAVRQKLLGEWNDTQHTYGVPEDATLYSLFDAYASAHPEEICLHVGSNRLTFGELRSRAENLDSAIRQLIGSKKSVIALITERSPEMYMAVYAIIRGGNAYLPIDPGYPPERIRAILHSSGAAAVLAQGSFTTLAEYLPCIDLTEFWCAARDLPILPAAAGPEDTAYVIYTSGSTGQPKGAMISHRSAVNRILWMQSAYPLGSNSVILQKTPYTFDVSVWELFWWGICGGQLAACAPGEHFLPGKILREVADHRVTHLHFVPSVFDLFLTYLEANPLRASRFSSVRHVFLSGEALSASLVRRFYALFPYPDVRLHNLYGPTECAVDVTFYDCVPEEQDPIPIGRPIFNTSVYILDPAMNLLPAGKQGQLCIGGVNVGQGYLNDSDLTAEKFVVNPFGPGRLYKTGDYASFREDGQILFHGRMDGQLKLHGQRIETGEIEAVICRTPGVQSAAVIPCRRDGQSFLFAFYCGTAGLESDMETLCRNVLPSYMVPSGFLHLSQLPLNGSGKLDRRVLRDMVPRLPAASEHEPPRTPEEELVCAAFARILNCAAVDRTANFFDLGGNSLTMISLLSCSEFEGISPAAFIADPTPEALARQISCPDAQTGWLQCLHRGTDSKHALILFPYAGGEAESFAAFVHCAAAWETLPEIYCVSFPHSEEDCLAVARELGVLVKDRALFVYSHCAGAAPALRVLALLQEQQPGAVRHYFAAAAIPPREPPAENLWHKVPDGQLRSILEAAGAAFTGLSEQQISDLFARFRRDTDFYTAFFQTAPRQINVPTTLFLSREDLFTVDHADAVPLWERYAANLTEVRFVQTRSHYFQSEQPETLLRQMMPVIYP